MVADRLVIWSDGDTVTVLDVSRGLKSYLAQQHALNLPVQFFALNSSSDLPEEPADVIVAIPTLATWSRLRHSSAIGQQPLRSKAWPWGLPVLDEKYREKVEQANRCLHQCLAVLRGGRMRAASADLFLFHTEDFGSAAKGMPAAIWQLKDVRQLARDLHLHRSVAYQCWYGPAASPSPIALLSSMSHPLRKV